MSKANVRMATKAKLRKKDVRDETLSIERKRSKTFSPKNTAKRQKGSKAFRRKIQVRVEPNNEPKYEDSEDNIDNLPLFAPSPSIPSPFEMNPKKRAPRYRALNVRVTKLVSTLRRQTRTTKPAFLAMPLEIRERIYQYVLISDKPIRVFQSWTKVYQRQRPGIETSILRTSKRIYDEAIPILYGGNSFYYLLRDAPISSNANLEVPQFFHDDYATDGEEEDYVEDDMAVGDPDGGFTDRLPQNTGEPDTIDVKKFSIFFRQLIVEAEHNRSSSQTQKFMADALRIFTDNDQINLHTITIRVTPTPIPGGGFTFVHFFRHNSPVLKAILTIPCQFLRVAVVPTHLNSKHGQVKTVLLSDLRHLRHSRRAAHQKTEGNRMIWKGDM